MSTVVQFKARDRRVASTLIDQDVSWERHLIDEGLQLLAAYRSINDSAVRRSIMRSVLAIAEKARQRDA